MAFLFLDCVNTLKILIVYLFLPLQIGLKTQKYDAIIETNKQNDDPWMIFILSELTIGRNLCEEVGNILAKLKLSLKDITALSHKDKLTLMVLCDNQVPIQWRRIWSGPKTVIEYIKAITHKIKEIEKFYTKYQDEDNSIISTMDFNNIFNVEAFLTAIKLIKSL